MKWTILSENWKRTNSHNPVGERTAAAENRAKAYKDSLVKAKMFKLHTALENMALDYSKKERGSKAIIASLQADKNQLLEQLVKYEGGEKEYKVAPLSCLLFASLEATFWSHVVICSSVLSTVLNRNSINFWDLCMKIEYIISTV